MAYLSPNNIQFCFSPVLFATLYSRPLNQFAKNKMVNNIVNRHLEIPECRLNSYKFLIQSQSWKLLGTMHGRITTQGF